MDGRHFDDLARHLSSRRTAIGGLLAGLLLPLEAAARDTHKNRKRKQKGKGRQRVSAQEACWRAGACVPGKYTNVSRCDLSGGVTFPNLDSTGSNLSRANLRGVNARNVNFSKANLSGACLVDADFTGATFANSTNLANAIFCRTTRPNGTVDNSGCGSGTACCPTCSCSGIGQVCNAQGACVCAPGWIVLANGQCGYPCTNGITDCTPFGCSGCHGLIVPNVCVNGISGFCSGGECPAGQQCVEPLCYNLCGPPTS